MNKPDLGNTNINRASHLPFSQACENNKAAILNVLQQELVGFTQLLEVGSGTGQHSVYFAPRLPHLQWQTSDVIANHDMIQAWHDAYPAFNLHPPIAFDLTYDSIPSVVTGTIYDAVFTANTLHIISWELVERLFSMVGDVLPTEGKFIVYGPFNENGGYTSASNQQFDMSLRQRDAKSAIRHKEDIIALANQQQLTLDAMHIMPAHNQLLVFKKTAAIL